MSDLEAALTAALADTPTSSDDLISAMVQAGHDTADVERVLDRLVMTNVFAYVGGGELVRRAAITERSVFTHVVTTDDLGDLVVLGVDLSPFAATLTPSGDRHDPETDPDDEAPACDACGPNAHWHASDDLLAGVEVGDAVAVRRIEGGLAFERLEAVPAVDDDLVARVRAAYDDLVAEPWVPIDVDSIAITLLADEPSTFDRPTAPLSHLVDAAGLEVRGVDVAHDESVWRSGHSLARFGRVSRQFDDDAARRRATDVFLALDSLVDDEPVEASRLPEILFALDDLDVHDAVATELVERAEFAYGLDLFGRLADALPQRGESRAIAWYLAALDAEGRGAVLEAEGCLERGLAAADWPQLVARAAWYTTDRGDVAGALALLRRVSSPSTDAERAFVSRYTAPTAGRNEPCPCGSGRKFKQCHLGRAVQPTLADRVPWLVHKARNHLEIHQSGRHDLVTLLLGVVDGDGSRVTEPGLFDLAADLALWEGLWFASFLEAREALLPADEAALARSWLDSERSLHEVVAVEAGVSRTLRDRRSGQTVTVPEGLIGPALFAGDLVLARVVGDGSGHQVIGEPLVVPPDDVDDLSALLDHGDVEGLVDWIAARNGPDTPDR